MTDCAWEQRSGTRVYLSVVGTGRARMQVEMGVRVVWRDNSVIVQSSQRIGPRTFSHPGYQNLWMLTCPKI